jgi:D-proline reductase (dithiol) PrdB
MNFAEIEREYIRRHLVPDFDWVVYPAPSPINPLPKRIPQCTVALIGTAGAHVQGDQPFDVGNRMGDPSFRVIRGDVAFDTLDLSHPGYNTRKVRQDINCVFPLERLRELAQEGIVGSVSARHFSFMGYIPLPEPLIEKTAPAVANFLKEDQVDLALLVPA